MGSSAIGLGPFVLSQFGLWACPGLPVGRVASLSASVAAAFPLGAVWRVACGFLAGAIASSRWVLRAWLPVVWRVVVCLFWCVPLLSLLLTLNLGIARSRAGCGDIKRTFVQVRYERVFWRMFGHFMIANPIFPEHD